MGLLRVKLHKVEVLPGTFEGFPRSLFPKLALARDVLRPFGECDEVGIDCRGIGPYDPRIFPG